MRVLSRLTAPPSEMIDQIGGWASGKIGESYGRGFNLKSLECWLLKTGL
jgi:hypothetical protein